MFDDAFRIAAGWVAAGQLPTAVLGVASARGVHRLEGFGADVDDRFAIFSITKVVSGLATMRAVEQGRMSLQTPLDHPNAPGITLEHLLSHRSGLSEPALAPPAGLAGALAAATADFAPGTASRYSSIAFEGVSQLVARATGREFDDLLLEVARLAGATTMSFDEAGALGVHDTAELGVDYPLLQSQRHPGAGLYARAADLLELGMTLLRDDDVIVHPSTLAAMRRPLTVGLPKLAPYPAERGQEWGLTLNLRSHAPGLLDRSFVGHGGWSGTELWLSPERDLCFVLMTNIGSPGRFGVDLDLLHNAVAAAR